MKYLATLLFLCGAVLLIGQRGGGVATSGDAAEQPNLVPNPGFERFSAVPLGWFYKGEHFTRVVKYWNAPTAASPDVFGPKVRVPSSWSEKDFGKHPPHAGGAMVGLTLYGCDEGKPHCREYVQIQLLEPLVVGQDYAVEVYVGRLPRSLEVNRLGFHFSEHELKNPLDERLEVEPQVTVREVMHVAPKSWRRITGRFRATTAANYLTIGNFATDEATHARRTHPQSVNYAYYYLDDVVVKKVPPILPIPVPVDDLSQLTLVAGQTFALKNIFFEFDRAELLPRSHFELDKLVKLLRQHPGMVIEIGGHTDNRGSADYNLDLSRRRAAAVTDYLRLRGVAHERVRYRGYGASQPLGSNTTETGRSRNRRVEFRVIELQ